MVGVTAARWASAPSVTSDRRRGARPSIAFRCRLLLAADHRRLNDRRRRSDSPAKHGPLTSQAVDRPSHVPAGLADDPDEAPEVVDRLDVRRGARVDRPDRHPGDRPPIRMQVVIISTSNSNPPSSLSIVASMIRPADEAVARLVVGDLSADGPRERLAADHVREPPDRRHRPEVAATDDEVGQRDRPQTRRGTPGSRPGRAGRRRRASGRRRTLRRAPAGSPPGAPRPCRRSAAAR